MVAATYVALSELTWIGTTFFPPAGLTVATLLLVKTRRWPIVLAAAATGELTVDLAHHIDPVGSLGYAVANTVEPLLGAALVRRLAGGVDLGRVRDLVLFLTCAVVGAPCVGGAIGATTFVEVDGDRGWPMFVLQWWVGDGLGVLVVGSAVLALRSPLLRREYRHLGVSAVAAAAVTATTTLALATRQPLLALVPATLMLLIAFRHGTSAVTLAGLGLAFETARSTSDGELTWGLGGAVSAVYLHLMVGFLIAVPLLLAAALRSRDAAVAELAVASRRSALVHTTSALAAVMTVDDTARVVAQHAAVLFGSSGALIAVQDGEDLVTIADPTGPARPSRLARDGPIGQAITNDRRVEATTPADLRERFPELADRLEPLGCQALAAVPLPPVAGCERGGLGLDFPHPRRLTEPEWQVLDELAQAAGQAIARARLIAAESTARRNATLLERTATRLAGTVTPYDVAEVSVAALAESGADVAAVWRQNESGSIELLAGTGVAVDLEERSPEAQIPGPGLTTDVMATGRAVFLQSGNDYDACYPHQSTTRREHAAESLAALPLRGSDGTVVGCLSICSVQPNWWTDARIGLVTGIAQQVGLALERARLLEHEHDTAMRLQAALLPDCLVEHPRLVVHARYRPGDRRLNVGGDWYETMARPDGRIALAVGDVVGHGLEAAATMGRLRTAFAALAQRSECPSEVLHQMDDFAGTVPSARTSTVVCAYLHPETGVLSYASAGHPPILLVSPQRGAEFLEEGRSWPLAVPVGDLRREQAERELEPGSILVLYSDGLVERRGESISTGLDRLRDAAERLYRAGFQNLSDALITELTVGQAIEDDVVVVSAGLVRD